jgi:hypothetical protein
VVGPTSRPLFPTGAQAGSPLPLGDIVTCESAGRAEAFHPAGEAIRVSPFFERASHTTSRCVVVLGTVEPAARRILRAPQLRIEHFDCHVPAIVDCEPV